MAEPTITVAAPSRRPRKGGLLNVVTDIRDNVGRLAVSAGVQYEAQPCGLTFDQIELCYTAFDNADADKETQGLDWGNAIGENFGAYYAVQCFLATGTSAEYEALATQGLEMGESRALEARLQTYFGTQAATAVATLRDAIVAAERFADNNYVGMPILHMDRGVADVALELGLIERGELGSGDLFTANGTPVVASGKYLPLQIAITGDITVLRSAIFANSGYQLSKNLEASIAERVYNLIVDCDFAEVFTFTSLEPVPTP